VLPAQVHVLAASYVLVVGAGRAQLQRGIAFVALAALSI